VTKPRLLIEEWLPAAAIGVECMRENSTGLHPPPNRLHIWWARRPLTVSRAAVLGSLLPADFPREVFERLLGFWGTSKELISAQAMLEWTRENSTSRIQNPHGERAFKRGFREEDLQHFYQTIKGIWGQEALVLDPMAGGGSIPLESARLGIRTIANEYNPVACTILEATVKYPFLYVTAISKKAKSWGETLRKRFNNRVQRYFGIRGIFPIHTYIFVRTVPCPDTGHPTPLVPDWHLLKPQSGRRVVAVPIVDPAKGTWRVEMKEIGRGAGQIAKPPQPTYSGGKGISLFSGNQIPDDYIKAQAQAGRLGSQLYAIAVKTHKGLEFFPPEPEDLAALQAAEAELERLRPDWEARNIIPTELYPDVTTDPRPRVYGMPRWADLFAPRQLLAMGTLVEELQALRPEIIAAEGEEVGEAIVHLLAFGINKFMNWNAILSSWNAPYATARSVFDRHDFSFKPSFCEMAPCHAGAGLAWAIDNVLDAYQKLAELPRARNAQPVEITLGSATHLPHIADRSITAVVVDPPYADNVQYSELADFFYVWLKRTQGHRRPEWFASYLCDKDEEAVVNISRHRSNEKPTVEAKKQAYEFYHRLMVDTFKECHRILRDDGVLTVMFTHKKQEAWESLFTSLITAGFTITATWPVKTESEHSLHQAKKNAAQSTVILVSRKRDPQAGIGYFDSALRAEIREAARQTANRLKAEGLNAVDQLVGSFGPAMEVFSRFREVRTDTGEPVSVARAIDEASEAVSIWRKEQLAPRGLDGVEPEGQFALLCWDVLGAEEFRFNEAKLLGHAVGMDVEQLIAAGLVSKSGEKIKILSAQERRRARPLEPDEMVQTLFGTEIIPRRRRKGDVLKIHPNDPQFRTALDGCQALALRYIEAENSAAGIGAAKGLALQQQWRKDSPVARLMEALVKAAPDAVKWVKGKGSAAERFPEFRAWHALLKPLFDIEPPDWTKKPEPYQSEFFEEFDSEEADESEE